MVEYLLTQMTKEENMIKFDLGDLLMIGLVGVAVLSFVTLFIVETIKAGVNKIKNKFTKTKED